MANLKNWQPGMTDAERRWFDACPKSVLFEMCRQLGMIAVGEEDADKAFLRMQEEWVALRANGIVPQRPHDVAKEEARHAALIARQQAFRVAHPDGVRLGDSLAARRP